MSTSNTYHGWIVVEDLAPGLLARVYVEYVSGDNKRRRKEMNSGGNFGCTEAIEWWDKKVGQSVKLQPLMKGCYRVYTEAAPSAEPLRQQEH